MAMSSLLLIVVATVMLGFSFLGLAIHIIFKKDHKFPNMHISGNKNLSDQGISCAQSWDKKEQQKALKTINYRKLKIIDNK
jgi:hypothetical protein